MVEKRVTALLDARTGNGSLLDTTVIGSRGGGSYLVHGCDSCASCQQVHHDGLRLANGKDKWRFPKLRPGMALGLSGPAWRTEAQHRHAHLIPGVNVRGVGRQLTHTRRGAGRYGIVQGKILFLRVRTHIQSHTYAQSQPQKVVSAGCCTDSRHAFPRASSAISALAPLFSSTLTTCACPAPAAKDNAVRPY